jgi:hypothetical protein
MAQELPPRHVQALALLDNILTQTPPAGLKQIVKVAYGLVPTLQSMQLVLTVRPWKSALVNHYKVRFNLNG